MIAAAIPCRWCGRACRPRRGGSAVRFCCAGHRTSYWTACRKLGERVLSLRLLSVAELKADPDACTLLLGRISRERVSEDPGEVIVSLVLDEATAMQVSELTWGSPFYPADPAELAEASEALLRQAIDARITASSRR